MAKRLPNDVVQFLLNNPVELESLQRHIAAVTSVAAWHAELAEKRASAQIVPCDTFGCTNPKNEMDAMCDSCLKEQHDDPDAFK